MGADPCHLTIARDGSFLVVSNYTGGTFASFKLEEDGMIEASGKTIVVFEAR